MMLGTFAAPFSLVGGYFALGLVMLVAGVFGFYFGDFSALSSFSTAAVLHLFLVGFVMSVIIGALYQLTSVIIEKPFSTIKGAYINLMFYALSVCLFVFALFSANMELLFVGGAMLFASFIYFGLCYGFSFLGGLKLNLARFALMLSAFYLIVGVFLGLLLVLVFSGYLSFGFDFNILLAYHVYFVLGFVFLVIVGAASVLLPMFALSHGIKFHLSKTAISAYILASFVLISDSRMFWIFIAIALACFLLEAAFVLTKRVRKALDYWNLNIILGLICAAFSAAFWHYDLFKEALFLMLFGFLFCFIAAHLYKIVPFLVWYHFISPFAGKTKVPLLDEMISKPMAFSQLFFSTFGVILACAGQIEVAILSQILAAACLITNMLLVVKYVKFKG